MLAVGVLLIWAAVCAVSWSVATSFRPDRDYGGIVVRADGTPLRYTQTRDEVIYHTLDGERLVEPSLRSLQGASLLGPNSQNRSQQQLDWRRRIHARGEGRQPATYWYLIDNGLLDGRVYLVGFDSASKRCVGYLGNRGFRADPVPEAEQFRVNGRRATQGGAWWDTDYSYDFGREPRRSARYDRSFPGLVAQTKIYLAGEDRLFEIDVRERTVRVLCEVSGVLSVGVVDQSAAEDEFRDRDKIQRQWQYLAVRFPDRVWLVHPESGAHRAFLLPEGLRTRWMAVYAVGEGLLLHTGDGAEYLYPERRLTWLDADGQVIREQEVTISSVRWTPFRAWQAAATVPAPANVELAIHVAEPFDRVERRSATTFAQGWRQSLAANWPLELLNLVSAVALAWWCQRRHRQYGLPDAKGWFLFVFLLGLAGVVGYLLHRRWAVREACPACQQLAPRNRATCLACGTTFPRPAFNGSEVFA